MLGPFLAHGKLHYFKGSFGTWEIDKFGSAQPVSFSALENKGCLNNDEEGLTNLMYVAWCEHDKERAAVEVL